MKHINLRNVTSRDSTTSKKMIEALHVTVRTAEDAESLELLESRTPEGENGVKELSRRVSYNEPVLSVMGPTKSEGSATVILPPFEVTVNENGRIVRAYWTFLALNQSRKSMQEDIAYHLHIDLAHPRLAKDVNDSPLPTSIPDLCHRFLTIYEPNIRGTSSPGSIT
ncbi:hypothetical protein ACEPAF_8809 [Sanghuangporus sanghuang]